MTIHKYHIVAIAAVIGAAALFFTGCPPRTVVPTAVDAFVPTRDLSPPKDAAKPTEAPAKESIASGPGRIMGFQVLLFSSKTRAGLADEMKRIAETGADTVIVRVFHNRGDRFYPFVAPSADEGVYFSTDRAPVVADALPLMIDAARVNGLDIWAWMTTRYAAWGNDAYGLRAYDFTKKRIVPAFGRDLFDDRKVDDLVDLYKDLAAYDIDGVLFQDDLILKHNEGMGETAQSLFGSPIRPETFYINPHPSPDGSKYYAERYTDRFWEWSRFKAARLAGVTRAVIEGSRTVKSDLKFAVNLSYEAIERPDNALAWLSEDINEFLNSGVDYIFIMAYHRQMMKEKDLPDIGAAGRLLAEITSRAIPTVGNPARVGIKLQVMDWDTKKPVGSDELKRAASYVNGIDRISLVFVPYIADAAFFEIQGIFKTAQGKK